jgi:hypothetical protein
LSIDPDVATTDQPYVFTNDDPLNSSDPLGNEGAGGGEVSGYDVGGGKVLPDKGDEPYIPPEDNNGQPKRIRGTKDFEDEDGRIWQWDPSHGGHWDVQNKNGKGYIRVWPNGQVAPGTHKSVTANTPSSGDVVHFPTLTPTEVGGGLLGGLITFCAFNLEVCGLVFAGA